MLEWVSLVAVPLLVALLMRQGSAKKDNEAQHADTANALSLIMATVNNVDSKIDRVDSKLDVHLGEHKERARRKKEALPA
jgi:hypothetical protein